MINENKKVRSGSFRLIAMLITLLTFYFTPYFIKYGK